MKLNDFAVVEAKPAVSARPTKPSRCYSSFGPTSPELPAVEKKPEVTSRSKKAPRRCSSFGSTTSVTVSDCLQMPSLRRARTDTKSIKSVLKTSRSSEDLGSGPSKASLGVLFIASNVNQDDEVGSPNLLQSIRRKRLPRKAVSFDFESSSNHTASTCSSGASKSSVEESVRLMKSLQHKFRRSSQRGGAISEAEQSRLSKEVPLDRPLSRKKKPTQGKSNSTTAKSA